MLKFGISCIGQSWLSIIEGKGFTKCYSNSHYSHSKKLGEPWIINYWQWQKTGAIIINSHINKSYNTIFEFDLVLGKLKHSLPNCLIWKLSCYYWKVSKFYFTCVFICFFFFYSGIKIEESKPYNLFSLFLPFLLLMCFFLFFI